MKPNRLKWDNAGLVESVVWDLRLADLPRSQNREIIQSLFNGDPPFDQSKAEENNVEINRNDLEGVDLISGAREQWNNAFLPAGNYFSVQLDSGPAIKRSAWSATITRNINKQLRRSKSYMEQERSCGGNAILHGMGPCNWKDRRCPIPNGIPVASLMIPSETEIDFDENLEYFAVFREWTPSKLYNLTHGLKRDPGWNMPLVQAQLKYVANKLQKEPNATAYQYMPERIEELIKQDLGFWGSDAVPTIDVWDFYFREQEDGKGWYRRVLLDWGLDAQAYNSVYNNKQKCPPKIDGIDNSKFLYTSGGRRYANSLSEIIHCQFADCSCYFPARYHSVRSLGWMLWGICDLQNRLHCKFNEQVFLQLMWFFRVASDAELRRLKSANFMHFGIIPPGVNFIPATDRFKPDMNFVNMAFERNQGLMGKYATSHTQDFDKGETGRERSATEIMAKLNATTARVSGMLNLAYTYEEFKDREICRRFCIKPSPYLSTQNFQKDCLTEGVPEAMLDSDRWIITRERVLGGGNQTLQMAIAQGIQSIRKNLGPDAQREADHLYVLALTNRPDLAEKMAPLRKEEEISDSENDAQLATDRLMRGLVFEIPKGAVPEDYVKRWLQDLTTLIQQSAASGPVVSVSDIRGFANMTTHINKFLDLMGEDDQERVTQYKTALSQQTNLVKMLAQRLNQHLKAQQQGNGAGGGGVDAKTQAEIQAQLLIANAKASNLRESHAMRTAQKQTAFELEEQRKDRELNAELRRRGLESQHEIVQNAIKAFQE